MTTKHNVILGSMGIPFEYSQRVGDPLCGAAALSERRYRVGLIHKDQGSTDRACSEFETALSLDPKHDQAKKALRELP